MLRLAFAALFALTCSLSAQVTYYSASLAAENEVPPTTSAGGGYGIVRLQEPANTVRVFVHYFGLTGSPTTAHLHQAPAGSNGGIVMAMTPGAGANTFTGTATVTAAQAAAIKSGGTYVNIHTTTSPGGEIRGQVVTSEATRLVASLDGSQEVPPVGTSATAVANAYLHEPDNRLVYCVESTGITGAVAGHLHAAPSGSNGGIVFPLTGDSQGNYCGVSPRLTNAQVATILADGTYLNIHTTSNPGGAIRGQLLKDPGSDYTCTLDGSQEVPPVTSSGTGTAALHIQKDGTMQVSLSFTGLNGTPVAAHIHNAPIGSNGGLVFGLTLSGGMFTGSFTPTAAQLAQLRAGDWYVNIHTSTSVGGEIRGQLAPAMLPETYGPSCPVTGGGRPEIGATRFAALGAPVEVDLYGGRPGAPSFLSLGFSRDNGLGQPLPLPVAGLGINAPCFLLNSAAVSLLSLADSNGCATRFLSIGYVPGLAGLEIYGQWLVFDPTANPGGAAASNGIVLRLQ